MVDGCQFYDNGVVGSFLQHNAYSQALGITYEYNYFGPLRSGAGGNNLKDPSAGTVIRYNYFIDGGHILDLVDPEDAGTYFTDNPIFQNTYVYGNVLVSDANGPTFLVHFGGDSGNTSLYRPNLYFYDNTVIDQANQSSRWRTILFQRHQFTDGGRGTTSFTTAPATQAATPTNFESRIRNGQHRLCHNQLGQPRVDRQLRSGNRRHLRRRTFRERATSLPTRTTIPASSIYRLTTRICRARPTRSGLAARSHPRRPTTCRPWNMAYAENGVNRAAYTDLGEESGASGSSRPTCRYFRPHQPNNRRRGHRDVLRGGERQSDADRAVADQHQRRDLLVEPQQRRRLQRRDHRHPHDHRRLRSL